MTLVEVLVAVTIVGVVATLVGTYAVPRYRLHTAMNSGRAELARYAAAQERYMTRGAAYASEPGNLPGYVLPPDFTVRSSAGTSRQWSLTIESERFGVRCWMAGGVGATTTSPLCTDQRGLGAAGGGVGVTGAEFDARTTAPANGAVTAGFTLTPYWPTGVTPQAATVVLGRPVAIVSTASDPEGWIASIVYNLGNGTTSSEASFEYTYPAPGTYTITQTVIDDEGSTASSTRTVTVVANQAPVAAITRSPAGGVGPNTPITFSSAGSSDADGVLVGNAQWWFGDGTSAASTGTTITKSYSEIGSYTVRLRVQDDLGATHEATTVVVMNAPPTAPTVTCSPVSQVTGASVTCTAAGSVDPEGGVVTYAGWSADGRVSASGASATYSWATIGSKTVSVNAVDPYGTATSGSTTVPIVAGVTSAFTATPSSPQPTATTYTLTNTSGGGVGSRTYVWRRDGVSIATTTNASFTPTSPGSYVISLQATDANGNTATMSQTLVAQNRAPTAPTSVSCAPAAPATGATTTCTAAGGTDPDGGSISYVWSALGRQSVSGTGNNTAVYSVGTPQTLTVTVQATDGQTGAPNGAQTGPGLSTTVPFLNRWPDFTSLVASASGYSGSNVTVSKLRFHDWAVYGTLVATTVTVPTGTVVSAATVASDPDGGVVSYAGELYANGSNTGITSATNTLTFTPTTPGTWRVYYSIRDNQGDGVESSNGMGWQRQLYFDISATNRAPSPPAVSCTPVTLETGTTTTCTASGSSDPDGGAVAYSWSAAGRTSATGATATYSATTPQTLTVSATATDGQGGTSTAGTATVTFINRDPSQPTVSCTPGSLATGSTTTCTASSTDPDGGTISYSWSAGSRTSVSGTGNVTATYSATTPQTLTVSVTAADGQGGTSTAGSTTVTFTNRAPSTPTVSCTPASLATGGTTTCTASTTDPDGGTLAYTWSALGRTSATGATATYSVATPQTLTVSVTAADDQGGTSAAGSTTVAFTNRSPSQPTVSCTPTSLATGSTTTCTASASSDPDGGTISYSWSVGSRTSVSGTDNATATYSATTPQALTVSVTATDGQGGTSTAANTTVTFTNRAPSQPTVSCTPTSLATGSTTTCTASSTDPDGGILAYIWSATGRTSASGNTATYSVGTPQVLTISAQATDGQTTAPGGAGTSTADSTAVTFTNRAPPAPAITCTPSPLDTGATTTCTASSTDPDGGTVAYSWSATGRTSVSGATATFSVNTPLTLTVSATATDGQGGTSAAGSTTVTFANRAPSAPTVSCTPTSLATGATTTCTASGGADPDGGTIGYSWGTTGRTSVSGATATYSVNIPQTLTVTVSATDGQGGSSVAATTPVTFLNRWPDFVTAQITATGYSTTPVTINKYRQWDWSLYGTMTADRVTVPSGTTVTMTTTAADPDGGTLTWYAQVSTPAGTASGITANANTLTFAPSSPGQWIVYVYVRDDQGDGVETGAGGGLQRVIGIPFDVTNRAPSAPTVSCTPASLATGGTTTCTASSADPDGGTVAYAWSATGLTSATGATATYSVATPQALTVSATATDGQGGTSAVGSTTVTFTNRAPSTPTVSCTPTSLATGSTTTCTASASTDPDGGTISYSWSVGSRTSVSGTGNATATYSAITPQPLTVSVTATDGQGGTSAAASTTVTFTNRDPSQPTVSCAPTTLATGSTTTCTASASTDPDGGTISYSWSVGSRTSVSGTGNTTATYSATTPQTLTVSVTATDGQGGTSLARATTVTFTNRAPSQPAVSCTPTSLATGSMTTCTAASTDPDGGTVSYNWSLDGRTSVSGATATYMKTTPQALAVSATATDGQGGTSAAGTTTVTFTNQAPSMPAVSCTPTSLATGSTTTCTASGSTDPDGGTIAYTWSAGSRTSVSGATATYSATTPQALAVSVAATDGQGGTSTAGTTTVTFTNRAPSPPAMSCTPTSLATGSTTTCTASGSTDPDGGTVTYVWSIDGRTSVNGATATYSASTPQVLAVSVTAYDGQSAAPGGAQSSAATSATVTFTNRAPSTPAISCTPLSLPMGGTATCTASSSSDPDGGTIRYLWSGSAGVTNTGVSGVWNETTSWTATSPVDATIQVYACDSQTGAPNGESCSGVASLAVSWTAPLPTYSWTATYGISASGWLASRGGYNLTNRWGTLSGNSTSGAYFGGSNCVQTSGGSASIKHIFVRANLSTYWGAIIGGAQNNGHEAWFMNGNGAGYVVSYSAIGSMAYGAVAPNAVYANTNKVIRLDFRVGDTRPRVAVDAGGAIVMNSWGGGTGYSGVFHWNGNLYLGCRGGGGNDFITGYIKEVQLFTTALSDTELEAVRQDIMSRWP